MLESSDVGASVLGRRQIAIGGNCRRHAGRPDPLAVDTGKNEVMQCAEPVTYVAGGLDRWRNQFEERFGEVRGDVAMRQGGAEDLCVLRGRYLPGLRNPQAFTLDAAQASRQLSSGQPPDSLL